ncbi:MAG: RIP metalloprotease RseP [Acidobacteria bacterium]|nr:RIP metalloprotease RseP [Acidobacteriota bacterium]
MPSNLLAVAVVLGVMIVIHEFGHYAAAKYFGVRVEVFSVGFGKRLWGFKRGDTDYRISLIPLGGYVKMSGENPMDEHSGDPGEFGSHPRWQRLIIAAAGPAMNILLAIALLTGVYAVHYEHPIYLDQPAVIGWVMEDSAAAKAGFQAGDRIVKIDGIQNPTWEQVFPVVLLNPSQPLEISLQRGEQLIHTTVRPEPTGPNEAGTLGVAASQPSLVTSLEPDMPAARAGLQVGDEIVAVDGMLIRALLPQLRKHLAEKGEQPVRVTIRRQGRDMDFTMTPVRTEIEGEVFYRIGIASSPTHVDKLPLRQAFARSLETNKKFSLLIVELAQKLVQRKVSLKQIDGPIRIASEAGAAARQEGWTPILLLTAAISLNLGVFNLFPIPILDGGMILLLLIESTIRRDISLVIKERIYQAAFVFLVLFAAMVIYNDIAKTLPGLTKYLP